jgi:hypothetical protein
MARGLSTGGSGRGITQTTVVLNDFGLAERQRTGVRGKTSARWTVQIKADKLPILLDPKAMGKIPAEAIARVIQDKIRGLNETVTLATQLYRKRAADSFRRGVPFAKRRYGGLHIPPAASIVQIHGTRAVGKASNRLAPMMPGENSPSFWRDSGRFIAGLIVRPTRDNEWVVNVPANRLDPVTFHGGREALLVQVRRLQELVPEFGDARALEKHPEVRLAIGESTDAILFAKIGRAFMKQTQLRGALRRGELQRALDIVRGVGGMGRLLLGV